MLCFDVIDLSELKITKVNKNVNIGVCCHYLLVCMLCVLERALNHRLSELNLLTRDLFSNQLKHNVRNLQLYCLTTELLRFISS